jgi:gamma-glutamylcysteine synthetase
MAFLAFTTSSGTTFSSSSLQEVKEKTAMLRKTIWISTALPAVMKLKFYSTWLFDFNNFKKWSAHFQHQMQKQHYKS